ncbi:MAG: C40 family peptidase [Duncaniella sp.]|nr:C40 family peptidase [Duncaniella sp.]
MKQLIYILSIALTAVAMRAAEPSTDVAARDDNKADTAAESQYEASDMFSTDRIFAVDSEGDVLALNPWEMLGEDDGLGDDFGTLASLQSELVDYASSFLGTRYRHGAKGPKAFDCSGFTSYVFKNFGMSLSSSSRAQGVQGRKIDKDEVMVGDLMFFSGRRGGQTIGHVGMVVDVDELTGKIKFIHAATSQGVVIQSFPDNGYYSQRFLQFRRVLDDDDVISLEARDNRTAKSAPSLL